MRVVAGGTPLGHGRQARATDGVRQEVGGKAVQPFQLLLQKKCLVQRRRPLLNLYQDHILPGPSPASTLSEKSTPR